MDRGIVFNIQRYSIHDGPGIRTTVFLKGCPLNCWWCHNPESKAFQERVVLRKERCLNCGACIESCKGGAITFAQKGLGYNDRQCSLCGQCEKYCPTGALEKVGKLMTVAEVMREVEKDRVFYEESKGGVTFSGGEPLAQHHFLHELLINCRLKGIHTVVDTSGYGDWDALEKLAKETDIFLYDLKHLDDIYHRKYTGLSNVTILENLKRLAVIHRDIRIRIPIIPGINDQDHHIDQLCQFVLSLHISKINILPYHTIGADKYKRLGEEYKLAGMKPPSGERMEEIAERIKKWGLHVKIGG
jgi:pyruvate formate lyase activating enzyme